MSEREKLLHRILTASQTGTIVNSLAERLSIPVYEAFRRFFKSDTYARLRQYRSFESMQGDPAVIDIYLEEIQREDRI